LVGDEDLGGVGLRVKEAVGAGVGSLVGDTVGGGVGLGVRDAVGDSVGCLVGDAGSGSELGEASTTWLQRLWDDRWDDEVITV
jgi:uncharacterized protein YcfJ